MLADVITDGRVKRAKIKWSECTKSRGLFFATQIEAYTDLDLKPHGSTVRQLLIVECAGFSNVNDIATEVRADHEARFVTRHKATQEQKKAAQ